MTVPNNDKYAGQWVLPVGRWANLYTKGINGNFSATILTAPPKGLYRVTLVVAISTAAGAGSLTGSVLSTGDNGVQVTQSLAAINVTAANIAQDSFICEVNSGDIVVNVTGAGTSGAYAYSLRIVIEQLSALT